MRYLTEEAHEEKVAKEKPRAIKQPKADKTVVALNDMAKASTAMAVVSKETIQAVAESTATSSTQNKELVAALLKVISTLHLNKEPTPVRLVINRKDRLISTIDVIPLTKKAGK